MYYIYIQRNLNQQIPESMGTQDTNEGKGWSPYPKGNILPFPPGSQQQRERCHCKSLKQEKTYAGAGSGVGVAGMGTRSVWESKTYCLIQHENQQITAEEGTKLIDMQLTFGVPSLSSAAPRLGQHNK